jgi:hypothetical protein
MSDSRGAPRRTTGHLLRMLPWLVCALGWPAGAQTPASAPRIHMIYMGGDDCPPCVAWRAEELPKLQQSRIFQSIRFSYVAKPVLSSVPAAVFLPADVKPYKEQLDAASGGNRGSPQTAMLVDGVVVDYYFAGRGAADIEEMILALQTGKRYPYARCKRRGPRWSCLENG